MEHTTNSITLRGELEALAEELTGNVTFLGYAPYGRMAAYLKQSDVTVNSLVRKASQSIVSKIGDYLAAGHPIISPVLVCNNSDYSTFETVTGQTVTNDDIIISVAK